MTDDPRISRLSECYTGVVHDVMRARGLRDFTLPPHIRPLLPDEVLSGPAWTVTGKVDESADAHTTLLEWTGLLSKAKPGHVWTAQPQTHEVAQMGELSAETLQGKGVLGCVIDGAVRDASFIIELGFSCWGTHFTPRDIVGYWLPTATEVEVVLGDVRVCPGDWLHGDRDGMVRIPAACVDEVIEEAVQAMETESEVREAIRAGTDPKEAYLKHGKF